MVMNQVFVGGLAWATNEPALAEHMEPAGQVLSVRIIRDRETGRSKGYGFVAYAAPEQALAAIERLHGTTLDGRTVGVSEVRPRDERADPGRDLQGDRARRELGRGTLASSWGRLRP